jgi:hypothetical protein
MKTWTLILTASATLALAAPAAQAVAVPGGIARAMQVAAPGKRFVAVDPLRGQRAVVLVAPTPATKALVESGRLDPRPSTGLASRWLWLLW